MATSPPGESNASLITGGAGFLGSHVVEALLADPERHNEKLVVLDDLSGGAVENLPSDSRVEFVKGCITDRSLVENLFRQYRFGHVYHLAAYAAEGLSHFIRRFNYMNNVVGSATLISAAIEFECDCFVFASSIAAYGSGENPLRETDPLNPEDPYGIAKAAVEMDLAAAQDLFGMDYIIFRPHNVYGERQNMADRYRNVVGIFLNQILQGKPMTIFGDGKQQRAFSYVRDVAPVIASSPTVAAARNEAFNIGADEPWAVSELAHQVAAALGEPANVLHLEERAEVKHAWCDHSKARKVFSQWRDTPLQEGLQRMADWARQQTLPESLPRMEVEVTRRLPPAWRESKG